MGPKKRSLRALAREISTNIMLRYSQVYGTILYMLCEEYGTILLVMIEAPTVGSLASWGGSKASRSWGTVPRLQTLEYGPETI